MHNIKIHFRTKITLQF